MSDVMAETPIAPAPLAPDPVARSPIAPTAPVTVLDGWEVSGARASGDLTLGDCAPLAKVQLKAAFDGTIAAGLPVSFGRAARDSDGVLVVGSGPGEWLLIGPVGSGTAIRERLAGLVAAAGASARAVAADELASVVDLTHGRALIRLTGPAAADVLCKVCGIDTSADILPDGAALRTSVAAVATDLIRDDHGGARSYLLHCERSSGQYLFDELLRAGAEYGIEISGFNPPGI